VGRYLLRRLGASLIVLVAALVLVFFGIRALPGDTALALAGEDRSPKALEAIRAQYGLDKPVPVQFVEYVGRAVRGDLGTSARTGISVSQTIVDRLPVTLELAALALLVALVLGIGAGTVAAVKRGSPLDSVASLVALIGLSVPSFWLGLVLILVFAVSLGWLPAGGYVAFATDPLDNLRRMLMPALVLGTALAAVVMRQTRAAMLDALGTDYVRTARAKGLPERSVIGGHALRNSLITVVTVLGLQLGGLISGAVVTEQVFVIPGFGKLTVDSVFQRDFPLIQGVVLVTTVGYIVVNLVVDVLYTVLDPRIRVAGGDS
jgi:peptide/nickel transport system permease protein